MNVGPIFVSSVLVMFLVGCSSTPSPIAATEKMPLASDTLSLEKENLDRKWESVNQRSEESRFERAKKYAIDYPDSSEELLKNFVAGTIKVGMDDKQIIVIMGQPWHKETSGGVGGTFDQWTYLDSVAEPNIFLYFSNRKLVRWHNLN